jgi:hypothetical protein
VIRPPRGNLQTWYYNALGNVKTAKMVVAEVSAEKALAMDPLHTQPNPEQLRAVATLAQLPDLFARWTQRLHHQDQAANRAIGDSRPSPPIVGHFRQARRRFYRSQSADRRSRAGERKQYARKDDRRSSVDAQQTQLVDEE